MAMISWEMMLIQSLLVPTLMPMNHENQTAMAPQESPCRQGSQKAKMEASRARIGQKCIGKEIEIEESWKKVGEPVPSKEEMRR